MTTLRGAHRLRAAGAQAVESSALGPDHAIEDRENVLDSLNPLAEGLLLIRAELVGVIERCAHVHELDLSLVQEPVDGLNIEADAKKRCIVAAHQIFLGVVGGSSR